MVLKTAWTVPMRTKPFTLTEAVQNFIINVRMHNAFTLDMFVIEYHTVKMGQMKHIVKNGIVFQVTGNVPTIYSVFL